jgi:hypothetical protein
VKKKRGKTAVETTSVSPKKAQHPTRKMIFPHSGEEGAL